MNEQTECVIFSFIPVGENLRTSINDDIFTLLKKEIVNINTRKYKNIHAGLRIIILLI